MEEQYKYKQEEGTQETQGEDGRFVPTTFKNAPNPNAARQSVYDEFFSSKLVLGMDKAMKLTYPNGEIVISLSCPIDFYEYLTAGWITWVPVVPVRGYHYCRKCTDMELLSRTLPGLTVGKTMQRLGRVYKTELLVTPNSPVRVMFNALRQDLLLCFFHQPVDASDEWQPYIRIEKMKPAAQPDHWRDSTNYPQREIEYNYVWHPVNEDIKPENWK